MDRDAINTFIYLVYQKEKAEEVDRLQMEKRKLDYDHLPLKVFVGSSVIILLFVWANFLI